MSATSLSRNGSTSPLGKLDDRIESFRIESLVKAKFAQVASQENKPPSEFLRDVIRVIALGPDEVKRMHCEAVDRIVKMLARK